MKRPTMLVRAVLSDAYMACGLPYDSRDLHYVEDRVDKEGMSFLTLTLPSLCDALERALERGHLVREDYRSFKLTSRSQTIPAIMQGMFRLVFDDDGFVLDEASPSAIEGIRQVTRLFKKVELPCSQAREDRAYDAYVENEDYLKRLELPDDRLLAVVSSLLWYSLDDLAEEIFGSFGQFGSGATAERASYNARQTVRWWYERSEACFPLSSFVSHREDDVESFNSVILLNENQEVPVKVTSVPKTLKAPRIISIEPSWVMLMQQSVAKPLMAYLESNPMYAVRFTDQTVNNKMARAGSLDRSNVTIDLKDASDLVSNQLVKEVFKSCPVFLDMIQSCRSRRARLPDGRTVDLTKFASMGSAMCFPIEAMVFYTLVVFATLRASGEYPSTTAIRRIAKDVSVYGDDLIVPSKYGSAVQSALKAYGLKVNEGKTFSQGFFRESCGGDYYKGHDVTPTYVRRMYSGQRYDAEDIASMVSTANQFYLKGYWTTAQFLRDLVELRVGPIPHSTREIGILTHMSFFKTTMCRWDSNHQAFRVNGYAVTAGKKIDHVGTLRGAMRMFLQGVVQNDKLTSVRLQSFEDRSIYRRSDHNRLPPILRDVCGDDHTVVVKSYPLKLKAFSVSDLLKETSLRDFERSVERGALRLKRRWAAVH